MTALTEEVIVPKQIKIKKSLLFLCKMNIINDVKDHIKGGKEQLLWLLRREVHHKNEFFF
jgi:hypothetical protein